MSRAINAALPEARVSEICARVGVSISDIETLPCGGTHLVCTTGDGAEEMRHQLRRHIIPGKVERFAFYHLRASY